MKAKCMIWLVAILIHQATAAQEIEPKRFKSKGFVVGYGPTFSDNTTYTVYYLTGDWSWSFSKPRKKDFLSIYFEPQVNYVRTTRPNDFEMGANLGLRNYIRINSNLLFYQSLGSGPHYISAEMERQATGFIFSDNLFIGRVSIDS